MEKAMSFNDIAIVYVKKEALTEFTSCTSEFTSEFSSCTKSDAISIMSNSNLVDSFLFVRGV